jgi:hypothetical protein
MLAAGINDPVVAASGATSGLRFLRGPVLEVAACLLTPSFGMESFDDEHDGLDSTGCFQ